MKTRNIEEILNSVVRVVVCKKNKDMTLKYVLSTLSNEWSNQLHSITMMEYHSKEQHELKQKMPRYYVSGTFKDWHTSDDNLCNPTNLMTIDIDFIDNPTIDMVELQKKIFDMKFVAACLKSVSGKGIYAIIPIEDYRKTKLYYNYIKKMLFKNYGVVIDGKASNIARARFISYNPDYTNWIKKEDVQVWQLYDEEEVKQKEVVQQTIFPKYKSSYTETDLVNAIKKVLNSGYAAKKYTHWYYTGCDFAALDCGRELWQQFCLNGIRSNPKWNDSQKEIDKKWNECLKNKSTIDDDFKRKWFGMAKKCV